MRTRTAIVTATALLLLGSLFTVNASAASTDPATDPSTRGWGTGGCFFMEWLCRTP